MLILPIKENQMENLHGGQIKWKIRMGKFIESLGPFTGVNRAKWVLGLYYLNNGKRMINQNGT